MQTSEASQFSEMTMPLSSEDNIIYSDSKVKVWGEIKGTVSASLSAPSYIIGRHKTCDIVIPNDISVSITFNTGFQSTLSDIYRSLQSRNYSFARSFNQWHQN